MCMDNQLFEFIGVRVYIIKWSCYWITANIKKMGEQ